MNRYTLEKINYDNDHDVLYCRFSDTNNSYGDEFIDNIVLLKDFDTDVLTGITVLDFVKMCHLHDPRIKTISKYLNVPQILSQIVKNCIK